MMFRSFNEEEFYKAIEENNFIRLKVNAYSAIINDPRFAFGEYEELEKILKAKVPEIFEEEVTLGFESRLSKEQWDEEYFIKLTSWFQENFALSRIPYIKEVGRHVYGQLPGTESRGSIPNRPTKASAPKKNLKKILIPVAIATGAVVLTLVIIGLVK